jgi:hypothetical protein
MTCRLGSVWEAKGRNHRFSLGPAPKGFTRAMLQDLQRSLIERPPAGARTDIDPGVGLAPGRLAQATGRGKVDVAIHRWL